MAAIERSGDGVVLVRAARVATPLVVHRPGWVLLDGRSVAAVGGGTGPPGFPRGAVVDLGDRLVAPGFVDLHVHGGAGAEVNQDDPAGVLDAVRRLGRFYLRHGTTALVPTAVADTPDRMLAAVTGVARATRGAVPGTPSVLGSHLEGPWLSPDRAGAQHAGALRAPDPAELARLLAAAGGTLRLLTLAPELPGALELVAAARGAGVTVAVGHTDADYETTVRALDAGARYATHLFNAMAPLHHRRPGPVAALLADRRVGVEVVADGQHLHPAVLRLAAALAGDRLVAVTDAVSAAGLPDGEHPLAGRRVRRAGDRVVLSEAPEVLAGSVLTLDRALAHLVGSGGLGLERALAALTRTPARVVGARAKGELRPGADADLVVCGPDLSVLAVLARGEVAYDPAGLLEAVSHRTVPDRPSA